MRSFQPPLIFLTVSETPLLTCSLSNRIKIHWLEILRQRTHTTSNIRILLFTSWEHTSE